MKLESERDYAVFIFGVAHGMAKSMKDDGHCKHLTVEELRDHLLKSTLNNSPSTSFKGGKLK